MVRFRKSTVPDGNKVKEISLLKAISVRNILMTPDSGSCKKYFPLIAERLRMKEAEVRYVWLHRNEVLLEWENCVPYHPRVRLNKVWMHSFLYGWIGYRRSKIDYSVISAVAKEWVSRRHSNEEHGRKSSNFKIQSGRKMLQFLPQSRKTDLSRTTWKMLNQQVKDYLQRYRSEVQKLLLELRTKITSKKKKRRVHEPTTRSNSSDDRVEHGLSEMEKLIYDSFAELLKRFFVPNKIISEMGKRFLSTPQLQWKTYIKRHIRTTKFCKDFRKKYNLVTAVDDSHQLYPFSIPILLKKIFIRVNKLEVGHQVKNVSPPSPPPLPAGSDERSEQNDIGTISVMPESSNCDSGSQPPVNKKPRTTNTTSRSRKRTFCRTQTKSERRQGKRWRDIIKCSQACSSPNDETMSQISDFVSQTLVEEMTSSGELAPLYAVLQEDPFMSSCNNAENVVHAHTEDNGTATLSTTASEDLGMDNPLLDYQDALSTIADSELNTLLLDNQDAVYTAIANLSMNDTPMDNFMYSCTI